VGGGQIGKVQPSPNIQMYGVYKKKPRMLLRILKNARAEHFYASIAN
jgi:hypothetical protein